VNISGVLLWQLWYIVGVIHSLVVGIIYSEEPELIFMIVDELMEDCVL